MVFNHEQKQITTHKMQFFSSIAATVILFMVPAALAANVVGDSCDPNANKEYTFCDEDKTFVIRCNRPTRKWIWTHTCTGGACYRAESGYARCKSSGQW